ncbi:sporulation integral membrane protein YlbJ [Oceanobacillus sp. CAU 1775]
MNPFFKTIFLSSITILLTILLIYYPDEALSASLRGLFMWSEVVFPSLLPFFITAELLLAFGVVKFLGVLFEPIMRPLFNVPGVGSFGWMMGMASGYPTGAKIAARLRQEKQISQIEAERLVSFTNNSSPLFIFGAVSIGLFHDPILGLLLAFCHYASNMIVGIIMRFHGRNVDKPTSASKNKTGKNNFSIAFQSMHKTRMKDKRHFGEILGDAVLESIKTLVMVGGFIILFSVITQLLHLVKISVILGQVIGILFLPFGIPVHLSEAFFSGLFEITLGATLLSELTTDSILYQAILVSFILGFNGFSIQAQVASILAKTDIRFYPYFFARIMHGLIASVLTYIFYQPLYVSRSEIKAEDITAFHNYDMSFWQEMMYLLLEKGMFITIACLGVGVAILLFKRNQKIDK